MDTVEEISAAFHLPLEVGIKKVGEIDKLETP